MYLYLNKLYIQKCCYNYARVRSNIKDVGMTVPNHRNKIQHEGKSKGWVYDDKNIRNPKHKDAGRGLLLLHAIPAFAFIYTAPYSCHYHCLCLQIYCILFLQLWYTVISIRPSSISLPSSSLKLPFCSLPSHESTCAK